MNGLDLALLCIAALAFFLCTLNVAVVLGRPINLLGFGLLMVTIVALLDSWALVF